MSKVTMDKRFYGRDAELELLHELQCDVRERGISRFVVVTGRIGVGKTRLIEEALPSSEDMPTISTYIASQLAHSNLLNFAHEIESALNIPYPLDLKSWEQALQLVFVEAQSRPITMVLEEFQNFSTVEPAVFDTLQKLWDRHHSKSRILIVATGSSSSMMREIFENGKAPLFGRAHAIIHLAPFLPEQLKNILAQYKADFTGDDLLALYALTGGVAKYVQMLLSSGALSCSSMLNMAVELNSGLIAEAQLMIVSELKGSASVMNELLMAISQGRNKRTALASYFDVDISGHLHKLEHMHGLIEVIEPIGENGAKRKRARYELTDELLGFWYRFCLSNIRLLQSSRNQPALQQAINDGYSQWSEHVLKRLYRRHFANLGQFTSVGPWWDKQGENEIDLVALNSVTKHIVFAEIRRDECNVDLRKLESKVECFLSFNPGFRDYEKQFLALSLKDLSSSSPIPYV